MKKLGAKGIKWLKNFHILFVCAWLGAGISMMAVQLLNNSTSGDELYGYYYSLKIIDDYVIIPGAMGCLFTGLIYSLFTNWGFFKYYWVMIKWVITVTLVLIGTFVLGPSLHQLIEIIDMEGLKALENTIFDQENTINIYVSTVQILAIIILIFISVLKPWDKRKKQKE